MIQQGKFSRRSLNARMKRRSQRALLYVPGLCSSFLSSTIGANLMGSRRTPPDGLGIHRLQPLSQ